MCIVRFASWNIGSLTGRCAELAETLRRRRVMIACIQETRWKGSKSRDIGEGYKLFYHGTSTTRAGVAVAVCEEMRDKVVEIRRVSERIMVVKLVLECGPLNVVSAYAPQAGCTDDEKEEFGKELDQVLRSISEERTVIGADLNGHVGAERDGYERQHGGHGWGARNPEGETILQMAQAHDLAIANTFFKKREEHVITYKSGAARSQIDYFLVWRSELKNVKNCKVIPGECLATQHRILVMDYKMAFVRKNEIQKRMSRIRWWKLEGQQLEQFKEKTAQKWKQDDKPRNVDEMWNRMAGGMKDAAKEVVGMTRTDRPKRKETRWWTKEVQEKVKDKKAKFKKWQRTRVEADLKVYMEAKKEAKRIVAKAKTETHKELYRKLETKEGEKMVFKLARTRERATRDIQQVKCIKNREGRIILQGEEVRSRWGEYFSGLLNEENSREALEELKGIETVVDRIQVEEVRAALKRMKKAKSAGPDEVPAEAFKALGELAEVALTDLFNEILEGGTMPDEWRKSILVPIFKGKGDVQECSNYRGIKLMSHAMKLWERVIEGRLRTMVEISGNQFGFVPGRSTTDAIFALRTLMEKYREKERDLHVVFIDLEKAYDRVPRELLWWCMRKRGIPEQYVRVVQDMYRDGQTLVRSPCGNSESFPVKVGVHQGSAISPFLFILVLDTLTRDIQKEAPWSMLFADDIVLCGETKAEIERDLKQWVERLEKHGLRISRSKTEYMTTSFAKQVVVGHISMGPDQVRKTTAFRYLGSLMQNNGSLEEETKNRVKAAWSKWREITGVLCDKKMPLWLKGKMYKAVVRPVLLYGSECWSLSKKEEKMIAVAEMRMLRWMSGISLMEHIRNEAVREKLKIRAIQDKMREQRLRWYGHVRRREPGYVGRRVQELNIEGTRPRGRPKLRWLDVVRKDMREMGIDDCWALDRKRWRECCKRADPT
jgi:Reverse transcriptase (RNA-dependent DNA polymerase)